MRKNLSRGVYNGTEDGVMIFSGRSKTFDLILILIPILILQALGIKQPSPSSSGTLMTPVITPLYHPVRSRRPSDMSSDPGENRH